MKTIKYNNLDLDIITESLDNGLDIYLIPNKNVSSFYITFSTKYGSLHTEFKNKGDSTYTTVPYGVAHFLEHLTFKLDNGCDASDYFAKLGSFSNAYTTYNYTCYEVTSHDKFKENLETLLDFVQTPCYDKEMVEAEKEIICSEVRMYEDDPGSKLYFGALKNVLINDNHRYKIAGNVEDVQKTTLKNIKDAYNTFYHPSNMFVVITGNFNAEEALGIIEENQSKKKFKDKKDIVIKKQKEPYEVRCEYEEIEADIELDKVSIDVKIPLSNFESLKLSRPDLEIYIELILRSQFGISSELRDRLTTGNIINSSILTNDMYLDDFVILSFEVETKYPTRYIKIMKDEIKNFNIKENDFNRKKRVCLASIIRGTDNIETMSYAITKDIIEYGKIQNDVYNSYNDTDYNVAKKVASLLNDNKYSITVLKKKEK